MKWYMKSTQISAWSRKCYRSVSYYFCCCKLKAQLQCYLKQWLFQKINVQSLYLVLYGIKGKGVELIYMLIFLTSKEALFSTMANLLSWKTYIIIHIQDLFSEVSATTYFFKCLENHKFTKVWLDIFLS